ncbi:RHO1 GDP-GTP exchange protein 2 [Chytriomyces hyalinus]|nr:RHO1 GDP-GTP exchange protein 2 [Chytriomyces hyalinus]
MFYPAFLSHVASAFRARVPLASHVRDGIEHRNSFLGSEAVDTIMFIINSTDRNLALVVGRCLDAQSFIQDVSFTAARLTDNADLFKMQLDPQSPNLPVSPAETETATAGNDTVGVFLLLSDCYSPTCSLEDLCYSVACPRRLLQLQHLSTKRKVTDVWSSSMELQHSEIRNDELKKAEEELWWSNTVPKEVLDSVSKEEEKRQNAIYDIIKTEKNYVEELKIIQTLYEKPLREGTIIESARQESFIKSVFCNASEILVVNSKILSKLLSRQKEAPIVEKIGDIFLNCANDLNAYIEYCGNREYSRNDIAIEKAKNAKFKEFLAKAIAKKYAKQDNKAELDGYLHKPIARMASYLLLLKAILDKTPPDHPDRTLIPQATTAIQEVLAKMNAASGKAMNKIKLAQLHKQIFAGDQDLKLLEPGREILYEGKLALKRATGGDYELTVFLFDHCLVMARSVRERKGDMLKGTHYKLFKNPILYELISSTQESKKSQANMGRSRTEQSRKSETSISPRSTGGNLGKTAASPRGTIGAGSVPSGSLSGTPITANSVAGTSLHPHGSSDLKPENKLQFMLTVVGRDVGGVYTFQADTESARNIWRDHISKMRSKHLLHGQVFSFQQRLVDSWNLNCDAPHSSSNPPTPAAEPVAASTNHVAIQITSHTSNINSITSSSVVNNRIISCCHTKDRLILATEHGLFVGPPGSAESPAPYSDQFIQIAAFEKLVSQIDVVPDLDLLLVLLDKTLFSYKLSTLTTASYVTKSEEAPKRKKMGESINFFRLGSYQGRTLVCTVRAAQISSTIKIFETSEVGSVAKKQSGLAALFGMMTSSSDTMKLFKEFYIPTEASSIHIFKTKLCIGCTKGFEIVDLESLETQALLDPSDDSLDFVLVREDTKPISIYKIAENEYILCYDEFAFFVDRLGRRSRGKSLIQWAGAPTSFAFISPYILAFDSTFIEIRNVFTVKLAQIIYANGIKLLQENYGNDCVLGVTTGVEDRQSLFKLSLLPQDADEEMDPSGVHGVEVVMEGDENGV